MERAPRSAHRRASVPGPLDPAKAFTQLVCASKLRSAAWPVKARPNSTGNTAYYTPTQGRPERLRRCKPLRPTLKAGRPE
eukprot:scaffold15930_cov33-Phaeocystis_antarctica.AAC.1